MQPRFSNQKTTALTLTELIIVIASLVLLAAIVLPLLAAAKRKSSKLNCASNLKQLGLALRMWTDDNSGKYPMQVSVTDGGAMESALAGDVAACFRVMSNTLDIPELPTCPNDTDHVPATNFESLSDSNISYFAGLDAAEIQPQSLLSGDDNLIINGKRVQPGILNVQITDTLAWTKERHRKAGNILLADGSVQQVSSDDLTSAARLATNRLAIP